MYTRDRNKAGEGKRYDKQLRTESKGETKEQYREHYSGNKEKRK